MEELNTAVMRMMRALTIPSAITLTLQPSAVATILADVPIQISQIRVRSRVVGSTLYPMADRKLVFDLCTDSDTSLQLIYRRRRLFIQILCGLAAGSSQDLASTVLVCTRNQLLTSKFTFHPSSHPRRNGEEMVARHSPTGISNLLSSTNCNLLR